MAHELGMFFHVFNLSTFCIFPQLFHIDNIYITRRGGPPFYNSKYWKSSSPANSQLTRNIGNNRPQYHALRAMRPKNTDTNVDVYATISVTTAIEKVHRAYSLHDECRPSATWLSTLNTRVCTKTAAVHIHRRHPLLLISPKSGY